MASCPKGSLSISLCCSFPKSETTFSRTHAVPKNYWQTIATGHWYATKQKFTEKTMPAITTKFGCLLNNRRKSIIRPTTELLCHQFRNVLTAPRTYSSKAPPFLFNWSIDPSENLSNVGSTVDWRWCKTRKRFSPRKICANGCAIHVHVCEMRHMTTRSHIIVVASVCEN